MRPHALPSSDTGPQATDPKLTETVYADPSKVSTKPATQNRDSEPDRVPGVGDWLGDAYCVERELGRGAMGVVLSAMDRTLGRRVAIKLIRTQLRGGGFRDRFMAEARAMALVSHPNVVTIHAFGEHAGSPFIVMELIDGQTLDELMQEQQPRLDLDLSLRLLNQICLGVSAIHSAGTLHRDLKPNNILLDRHLRARVTDLGLAIHIRDGARVKEMVGTPGYMAPEILFDTAQWSGASPQSDLYALGCIAYQLLTGQAPFYGENDLALAVQHATARLPRPSEVCPDLPHAFDAVLEQALAKDPRQRQSSVELFRRSVLEARNDSLEPVRILVAEDDEDFRELLELVLHSEFPGADIECVSDGLSAIRAFERKPSSVLVIDLQLPKMDGVAITKLLRSRPEARQVPIIVMTASGGPDEWRLLSSLGADRFLVKPVNLDDVVATIRRATRERSSSPGH